MTDHEEHPSAQVIVADLLDATAKAILATDGDLSTLGGLFVPLTEAIVFLERQDIDPPRTAYGLLLFLITSGAATSPDDE